MDEKQETLMQLWDAFWRETPVREQTGAYGLAFFGGATAAQMLIEECLTQNDLSTAEGRRAISEKLNDMKRQLTEGLGHFHAPLGGKAPA